MAAALSLRGTEARVMDGNVAADVSGVGAQPDNA